MDDRTLSHGSEGKPRILREFEFYGGCIRVKISVKNTSDLSILDAELELKSDESILHFDRCEPEEYHEKKGKIILGNINPHNDRTIAFYLDPLICAKEGTDINCRVNFKYADGTLDTVYMEKLRIQVVCPIFRTEHDINIGRLKELIKELHSHDSTVYTIPKKVNIAESLKTCRNVIQQHDVRHIKTFKTTDDTTYECWYFGKTKVTKKDLVIKCAIRKDTESIEIFVSGNDPKDITGLLAEIGRNITKEFDMGSPSNEKDRYYTEGPVHRVKISNAFYMGTFEVTQKQWRDVMGNNPSSSKGDNRPVEMVSWNDVQDFIKKLNEKEGWNKYRLPSEAEWEYALRAGTKTRYSFGDDESNLGDYAWIYSNSGQITHSVGQKKPNLWGLYDMHGNVWEMVQDNWHSDYSGAPTDGSAWDGSDSVRVVRGGWLNTIEGCRSANRDELNPGRFSDVGFRLLRIS